MRPWAEKTQGRVYVEECVKLKKKKIYIYTSHEAVKIKSFISPTALQNDGRATELNPTHLHTRINTAPWPPFST